MATKNNRRTLITKRILKESLLELMQTKSISKITIKEICDLSDMSRSTFYLHYQDQFELLEDIEKEVLKQTFQNLQALDKESTALESIEIFLRITLKEQPLNHIIHDFKTINGFNPFHTVKSSSENSSTLDNSESLISTW